MAISRVGSATAATTSLTMPSGRQIGDVEIMWAFRSTAATVPTLPSGWLTIVSGSGNTCAGLLAYRVCINASDTSGTWTGATQLICTVYRGVTGIGPGVASNATGTSVNFPALTMGQTAGNSWIVGVAGHRTATNVSTAPTGMTNVTSVGTGPMAALHDSNGGKTSWSSTNLTVNASSGHESATCELRADGSTWGVQQKGAGFTISSNGLTLTSPSVSASGAFAMTSIPRTTGKVVFKVTVTHIGDANIGIAPFNSTFTGQFFTTGLTWGQGGDVDTGASVPLTTIATYGDGNVLYYAFDLDNRLFWGRVGTGGNWNNSGTANPDTGSGGISYTAITAGAAVYGAVANDEGDTMSIVWDGTAASHGLSNFLPWDTFTDVGSGIGIFAAPVTVASGTFTGFSSNGIGIFGAPAVDASGIFVNPNAGVGIFASPSAIGSGSRIATPWAGITRIASSTASATTITMPTGRHLGDIELMWAYNSSSTTLPTVPTGWALVTSTNGNVNAGVLAYRYCGSASDTSGTWANATDLICVVYRGVIGIGQFAVNNASSTTVTYPAVTLQEPGTDSWLVGFAGHKTASNLATAPTGMTNITSVGTGPMAAAHDSNQSLDSWSIETVTANANSGTESVVVELLGDTSAFEPFNDVGTVTWTLTNNNRSAVFVTDPNGYGSARVGLARATGKYVGKFTVIAGSGFSINCGVGDINMPLTEAAGVTTNGTVCTGGGDLFQDASNPDTISALDFAATDVVLMAVDVDNLLIWWKVNSGDWNGGGTANPDTGTGGFAITSGSVAPLYPVVATNTAGDGFTWDGTTNGGLTHFVPWDSKIMASGTGIFAAPIAVASGTFSAATGVTGTGTGTFAAPIDVGTGYVNPYGPAVGIFPGSLVAVGSGLLGYTASPTPILPTLVTVASIVLGYSGSGTATFGSPIAVGTAALTYAGSATGTFANLVSAVSGTVANTGSGIGIFGAPITTGQITLGYAGTSVAILAYPSVVVSGTYSIPGSAGDAIGIFQQLAPTATGRLDEFATATPVLPNLVPAASGVLGYSGSGVASFQTLASTVTGSYAHAGSGIGIFPGTLAAVGTGKLGVTGSGAPAFNQLVVVASIIYAQAGVGIAIMPDFRAEGSGHLDEAATGVAAFNSPIGLGSGVLEYSGSAAGVLGIFAADGVGAQTPPGVSGTAVLIPRDMEAAGTGTLDETGTSVAIIPVIVAAVSGTLGYTGSGTGQFGPVAATGSGKLNETGSGVAIFAYPSVVVSGSSLLPSEIGSGTGVFISPAVVVSGILGYTASPVVTFANLVAAVTGRLDETGSGLGIITGNLAADGTGRLGATGSGTGTFQSLTDVTSGVLGSSGTGEGDLPYPIEAGAVGTFTMIAIAAPVLPGLRTAATGTITFVGVNGDAECVLEPLTVEAVGGFGVGGTAVAVFESPIALVGIQALPVFQVPVQFVLLNQHAPHAPFVDPIINPVINIDIPMTMIYVESDDSEANPEAVIEE